MSTNVPNIGSVEAAKYLGLGYMDFIRYVNTGKIVYRLLQGERFFTRAELNRFKTEVLQTGDTICK
jgi:hypothetical protein